MPGYDDGTPSLGEIARIIKDFRDEYRVSVSELVRKDVYAAEQRAQDAEILDLKTQAKSRQNLLYGTLAAAALSILGWVLTALSA